MPNVHGLFAQDWQQQENGHAAGFVVPVLSVVVPILDEIDTLPEFYHRVTETLNLAGIEYEIIFINDGSTDGSAEWLDHVRQNDERLSIVHFSRNFGHQAAITAGLDLAQGETIAILDGDLQDPPELLPQLLERWREGYEVVYAVRTQRKEHLGKRLGYSLFYRLMQKVGQIDLPLDSGDFCLMDRAVVSAMNQLPERNRFVRGLRSFVGFRQIGVPYERQARLRGNSKYTLRKLMGLATDGIFDFSRFPVQLLAYSSGIFSIGTLGFGAYFLGQSLLSGLLPPLWQWALLAFFVLATLQTLGMTILGTMIQKIFTEVKQRPSYIVREMHPSAVEVGRPRPRLNRAVHPAEFRSL